MWFEYLGIEARRTAAANVAGTLACYTPKYGFRLAINEFDSETLHRVAEEVLEWLDERYGDANPSIPYRPDAQGYLFAHRHYMLTWDDQIAFEFRMRWC